MHIRADHYLRINDEHQRTTATKDHLVHAMEYMDKIRYVRALVNVMEYMYIIRFMRTLMRTLVNVMEYIDNIRSARTAVNAMGYIEIIRCGTVRHPYAIKPLNPHTF